VPAPQDTAGLVTEEGRVSCRTCHQVHGAEHEGLLVRSAAEAELCLSCHADHGPGRSLHPLEVDADAEVRERVASFGGVLDAKDHLTCLSCHDPHQSTAATLLRARGGAATACAACHDTQRVTKALGGHAPVRCVSCHGMHEAPRLPRGERAAGAGPALCLDCHTRPGEVPWFSLDQSHPVGVLVQGDAGGLPLSEGKLICTTCHAPHGEDARLLRLASTAELCAACHPDQDPVRGTDHDAMVAEVAGSADTCVSCHDVHGSRAPFLVEATPDVNPASGRCLACHDGSTRATDPGPASHPAGLLLTVAGLPFRYDGPVPYFDAQGRPSTAREAGEITCATCHDPHRWKHGATERPGAVDGTEQDSFLRDPDSVVTFCSVCHGVDGRPSFRFFHTTRYRDAGGKP
jgi:predicted CXXCH cytochrome family protein